LVDKMQGVCGPHPVWLFRGLHSGALAEPHSPLDRL